MKETADMVMWRKEFENMKTEEHLEKLKALGLDEEDLEEFQQMEKGVPLEKEILGEEAPVEEVAPKKKAKK